MLKEMSLPNVLSEAVRPTPLNSARGCICQAREHFFKFFILATLAPILTTTSAWLGIFFFFLSFNYYLFIYFWLCWVFVSVRGLSLVVASGGHSSLRCAGFSLSWPLLLRSTGSRRAGSVVVAHGPSCSVACGIFPDQGSNPCPLHWQADSQPLRHRGSPLAWNLNLGTLGEIFLAPFT